MFFSSCVRATVRGLSLAGLTGLALSGAVAAQDMRAPEVTVSEMSRPPSAVAPQPRPGVAASLPISPETVASSETVAEAAPLRSLRPVPRDPWAAPDLRWDGHPQDMEWTLAAMAALRGPGAPLVSTVPQDIDAWCPGYAGAPDGQRRAFWAGLISALAWHESTHSASAVGGGGQWFGLVQISPGTARWRGCSAQTGEALLDGEANLRCGLRIMGHTVRRDGVVARGMRGVAADWGPFHSDRKREDMRLWLRDQPFCESVMASSPRPVMRPVRS